MLIALSELGKSFWLEEDVLANYLNLPTQKEMKQNKVGPPLNYFSLTVSLFYMRDKVRYNELRKYVEKLIIENFKRKPSTFRKDGELTLLFFDMMSCPYINKKTKFNI